MAKTVTQDFEGTSGWQQYIQQTEAYMAVEAASGGNVDTYRRKIRMAQRTVESIQLSESTGITHCACCLKPLGEHLPSAEF